MKVPQGWMRMNLGGALTLQRGFDLPKRKRKQGLIPIISSSGPSDYHDTAKVEGPGIVTGRYGTIGKVYFVEDDFWPLNTTLWVKDFKGNDVNFLSHLLSTIKFERYSDKSGVPGVDRNDLHTESILLPPLPEQRKIAEILGAWDEAIEKTDALIQACQVRKKALMQRLLTGKTRFAEFSGKPCRSATINSICKKITSGGTPSRKIPSFYTNGTWPWLKTQELKDTTVFSSEEHITQEAVDSSSAKVLPANSVLMAMYGATIGKLAILGCEMTCNQACCAMIVDESIADANYLFFALLHMRPRLMGLAAGAAQPNLTGATVKSIRIRLPKLIEQRQISNALLTCEEEMNGLRSQRDQIEIQKRGLMQKLLTGKIRVKE